MPDYGDYVFIYDKEGNEYACPVKAIKGQVKKVDKLTEDEKKNALTWVKYLMYSVRVAEVS